VDDETNGKLPGIDSGYDDQDREETSELDNEALYRRLRDWYAADAEHSAKWRRQAKADFGFVAGDQWDRADKQHLEDQGRPVITFNRTLSIIKAVCGIEINARHETVYMPRGSEPGQVRANEILTAASQWMSDGCDAEDEQSSAFQDCVICGMGWTEARIDYDEEPDGQYMETRVDPLEMVWDRSARSKNLVDARRVFRVRKMSLAEAREMFPDVPDDELDAPWALGGDDNQIVKPIEERRMKRSDDGAPDPKDDVHVVHAQWWEKQCYYRVPDPVSGQLISISEEEYEQLQASGYDEGVKQYRKVYKQAFLGGSVIGNAEDGPGGDRFTWQSITGELDRNEGTFYGLVSVMRDPQMWANKWLSQTLHILNTTAKGGIIAEADAFKDQRAAQDTYAQPDAITWAAKGAIAGGKIMQKPGVGIPTGYINLLEFAITSIRDATGINMELLGARDANQPGILEHQRKQAAMSILSTLFDSLRRFRKQVGRVRLHFIQQYLSDGRLIRVAGQDGQELVPLMRDQTMGDYEVIVEDAPTSPNSKEQTWATIQQVLPAFKELLTPEAVVTILEYSPLPSKLVSAFKEMINQPPPPEAELQKQMAIEAGKADLDEKAAKTDKYRADAEATRAKAIADLVTAAVPAAMAAGPAAVQNVMSPEPWSMGPINAEMLIDPNQSAMPQMPVMPPTPPIPGQQPPELPVEQTQPVPPVPPPYFNSEG